MDKLTFIFCISLYSGQIPADPVSQGRLTPSSQPPSDQESIFSLLDGPQQYIASSFLGFSKSLDEFFSDQKAEYENSGSYIRLTGDTIFTDGEGWGFSGSTRARLVLPNTQQKLKLVFETDPDQEREDPQPKLDRNPINAAENKSYFAGLEGLIGEFRHWRFRPGIGLKLNRKADIFMRFRASRNYYINAAWQAYFGNTLYWFNSIGLRFDTLLEFDHRFDGNRLFRSATRAKREQQNDFWDLAQIFSITQRIDDRQAMVYLGAVYGVNEPLVHAENYQLQMRYRRKLHANYLFLELIPQIQYQKDYDFKRVFSFTLRLEMVFSPP